MDCLPGLNSPDTALYESLKLLCSLLVTLVGKGLYGSNGGSSEMRFIGQGDLVPDVNNRNIEQHLYCHINTCNLFVMCFLQLHCCYDADLFICLFIHEQEITWC